MSYFLKVIDTIIPLIKPGGRIILGDIRNLDLIEAFSTSVLDYKNSLGENVGELRSRIAHAINNEEELLLSPTFFTSLDQRFSKIGNCNVYVKTGQFDNEMQSYRYDVVLEVPRPENTQCARNISNWHNWKGTEYFEALLSESGSNVFGISGVPNIRVSRAHQLCSGAQLLDSHNEIEVLISSIELPAPINLCDLKRLAEKYGFNLFATWSQENLSDVDLVLVKGSANVLVQARSNYRAKPTYNHPQISSLNKGFAPTIRKYLNERLPDFMVPSQFVLLPRFPMTTNGKVDRERLPKPLALPVGSYVAPKSGEETLVQDIWQKILKLEMVSVEGNFFEMGGHSLLAVRIANEIRDQLDVECTIRNLFEFQTIRKLVICLNERRAELTRARVLPTCDRDRAPLSFSQQRLWFIDQFERGSAHYNMCSALKVNGKFDVLVAEQAITQLIERHEILRTVYRSGNGGPVQVILKDKRFKLKLFDFTCHSEKEQNELVRHTLKRDERRTFKLDSDLMLRALFIRLSDSPMSGLLQFNVHHIAADGWSLGILRREFVAIYEALRKGDSINLAPQIIQYADYALWQKKWFSDDVLEQQMGYWRSKLTDLPAVHSFPLDYPRPVQLAQRGRTHKVTLSKITSAALRKIRDENKVTGFMLLHAIFQC